MKDYLVGTIPTHEDTESHEPKLRNVLSELPSYIAGRRASDPSTAALASNESHETPIPSVPASVVAGGEALSRYPDMGAVELRNWIAVTLGTPGTTLRGYTTLQTLGGSLTCRT